MSQNGTSKSIEIKNINIFYGPKLAVENVSLPIHTHKITAFIGPSGCGKTTLLRLIAGFEFPTSGSIRLHGQPLEGLPAFKRPVNTVFQSYALFPHLTVAQNVGFGLVEARRPASEVQATVSRMLALVRLDGLEHRKPGQLSGGQQQRVALARALANRPQVLLLDESLSALDYKLRKDMQLELKRLQSETGITFVFVTHDQEEALTMSDRIAVMRAGRVEQVGTPTDIYDRPRSRYVADFIGETNFLEGRVHGDRVLLNGGGTLELDRTEARTGPVSLAVRPERASLTREGGLEARIGNIVYNGADTVYHLEGRFGSFKVRVPNAGGAARAFAVGETAGIAIPGDAIQVLES